MSYYVNQGRHSTPKPEQTALYRLHDIAGKLLYVGISHLPHERWKDHKLDKYWWHLVHDKTLEWFETRPAAIQAEAAAVFAENPAYNRIYDLERGVWTSHEQEPDYREQQAAILENLRSLIQDGVYPVGSTLPGRSVAAAEHGVAPAMISSVYGVLRYEGFLRRYRVISQTGRGQR